MKKLKKKITKRIIKTKREILDKIKIYIAYFKIKFLNEIQYKIAAFAGVVTQFVWGGMYIMLYTAFLKNGSSSDYTVAQISTYIWLQQAFYVLFNIWSIDNDILEQCENGSIAMELIRPVNLYSIWHAKTLGKKIAMVTLRAIPIIIICSMPFLGDYKLAVANSLISFILFIITLVLSVALMMSYVILIYIGAMKTTSSRGIKTAFHLTMEGLSGGLIPIAFMPNIVIKIIKLIPFNIYNGYINNPQEIIKIIILQITWMIILTYIGRKTMAKQLSKIAVQGG